MREDEEVAAAAAQAALHTGAAEGERECTAIAPLSLALPAARACGGDPSCRSDSGLSPDVFTPRPAPPASIEGAAGHVATLDPAATWPTLPETEPTTAAAAAAAAVGGGGAPAAAAAMSTVGGGGGTTLQKGASRVTIEEPSPARAAAGAERRAEGVATAEGADEAREVESEEVRRALAAAEGEVSEVERHAAAILQIHSHQRLLEAVIAVGQGQASLAEQVIT